MDELFRISYISRSLVPGDVAEIVGLMRTCNARNPEHQITGCLYYDSAMFFQVIEGPADAVERLFRNICEDRRHTSVHLLSEGPIVVRSFGNWAMKFVNGIVDPGVANELSYEGLKSAPATGMDGVIGRMDEAPAQGEAT